MLEHDQILTVATWNIGGGILGESHQTDGTAAITYHVQKIADLRPTVLCLQEAHEYDDGSPGQATTIARGAGYANIQTVSISPSHLSQGASLSISIMSDLPLDEPKYTMFDNPGLENIGPNGERWVLFDKGYLVVRTVVHGKLLQLTNAHCFPLHYFNVRATDGQFKPMWDRFAAELAAIAENGPSIAAIDLNYEPIDDLLGSLVDSGGRYRNAFSRTPTTPKGQQQDYIIYSQDAVRLVQTSVVPTEADHSYCQASFVVL